MVTSHFWTMLTRLFRYARRAFVNDSESIEALSALGQEQRFKIVQLLAKAGDAGLQSGQIAQALNITSGLCSTHLATLTRSQILWSRRDGRTATYGVAFEMIDVLLERIKSELGSAAREKAK